MSHCVQTPVSIDLSNQLVVNCMVDLVPARLFPLLPHRLSSGEAAKGVAQALGSETNVVALPNGVALSSTLDKEGNGDKESSSKR